MIAADATGRIYADVAIRSASPPRTAGPGDAGIHQIQILDEDGKVTDRRHPPVPRTQIACNKGVRR